MKAHAPNEPKDEAFELLALHDWDVIEALRTVLAERDALEEQLQVAAIDKRPGCFDSRIGFQVGG